MHRQKNLILAVALFCLFLITGCNMLSSPNLATDDLVLSIGTVHPQSGDYVNFARGIGPGIEYAIEDFTKQHDGVSVVLHVEDDQSCNKQASLTGMKKLVSVHGVSGVVGPFCSSIVLTLGPVAQEEQVLLMSGSSSAKAVSQLGDYVFRTYPSDESRSEKIAGLLDDAGYDTVALVYDVDNDAAMVVAQDVEKYASEHIAFSHFPVTPDHNDFRTILTKAEDLKVDAIVFAFTGPNQISTFLVQAQELGLSVPLYSPVETVEDQVVLDTVGSLSLVYATFIPDDTPSYKMLSERYIQRTGDSVVPSYLAENYDGTMLVLEALYQAEGDPVVAKELLLELGNGYSGASGVITFDKQGDVKKEPVLMTIANGAFARYIPS